MISNHISGIVYSHLGSCPLMATIFLTLHNITISVLVTYFFQITNFDQIQQSTRGRNEPILLFFHLFFFLTILFILTYNAQYQSYNISLKVQLYIQLVSYLTVPSYTYIPQLHIIHIMNMSWLYYCMLLVAICQFLTRLNVLTVLLEQLYQSFSILITEKIFGRCVLDQLS